MRKREKPMTRAERLEDLLEAKLDRLRDPLVPSRGVVKKRPMRTPDDLPRWDYTHEADRQGDAT